MENGGLFPQRFHPEAALPRNLLPLIHRGCQIYPLWQKRRALEENQPSRDHLMRQNILLITADQFRYDAMGHVGVFPVKTPNLDGLAAGGASLEAYTSYPMCCPARASIMTGLPASRHGAYYNGMPWRKGLETLPQVLSENGYYTNLVGKTHFYPPRFQGGFDHIFLSSDARKKAGIGGKKTKNAPGHSARVWDETIAKHYQKTWKEGDDPAQYSATLLTTHALSELEWMSDQEETREPFFMWLSLLQPHSPCNPPPPYSDMYRPEDLPPPVRTEEEKLRFSHQNKEYMRGWRAVDEETLRSFRARYLGDVSLVDAQVGRVLQKLEELGIRENTLVIFSSDHGEYMGDHHQMQKGGFHECASRVPMIFNGPGVTPGWQPQGLASLYDLKPTLMDYCGLLMPSYRDDKGELLFPEWTPARDTMSLLPAVSGENLPEDRVVYSEIGVYGQGLMARRGKIKYCYYVNTREFQMFDLESDPNELHCQGQDLTWETLPDWARDTFSQILKDCEPLRNRHYEYDGIVRAMFT